MSKAPKEYRYRTYRFKDRDPIMDRFMALKAEKKLSAKTISERSDVSISTLGAWQTKTRRPQHCTIMAALRAMGVDLTERPYSLRDGKK